ncbi:hypothetical protein Ppa06_59210 [Planomonospora parontospora subsp. parontospora]|uniref:Calx-beta domain-containing protein n=2 Tax=Planomonospora parontospora TaxID=58119 RepID=A0AA37F7F0_9ACTN|nr:hypothetical protein GCM10010126_59740 [Planomonospora parontospora]GII12123.1 hypothetical protein Ppa06_59210 [Planomonospora parontospora subsp. parontospora]
MRASPAAPVPAGTLWGLAPGPVLAVLTAVLTAAAAFLAVPGRAQAAVDGAVTAWGYNGDGQADVPAGLTGVTQVAGGYYHSLALRSDGTVTAWGYNGDGQADVPAGLTGVTQIAAGYHHSLALRSDGTVTAWGGNDFGQAGVPAGLTDVTQVAAGAFYSLALKSDGTVTAWGDDARDLIDGAAGLAGVTRIAAAPYHSLALKSDGTVTAWGMNMEGETDVPAGLTGVTRIAAGYHHSLALKPDGTVTAWGGNDFGQAGVPAGLTGVTQIAAGDAHSLALRSDGTVTAWGRDDLGQTGVPAGLANVAQIAAGSHHSLALSRSAVVFQQTARTVTENAGAVPLTVTRTGVTSSAEVRYAHTGGRATSGSDFVLTPGTLTFAPGQATKAITLTIRDDTVPETAETLTVTLSSPGPGTELRSPATMTVTIAVSDQRPDALISASASSGYVGNNVYTAGAAAAQTKAVTMRRTGRTLKPRSFYVRVYNDGTDTAVITIKGGRAAAGSAVRYFSGSSDVTARMHSAAGLRVALARGAYRLIRVQLQLSAAVPAGSARYATVWGTWSGDGTRSDVVRAAVKVSR